jgi:hypothetical protein
VVTDGSEPPGDGIDGAVAHRGDLAQFIPDEDPVCDANEDHGQDVAGDVTEGKVVVHARVWKSDTGVTICPRLARQLDALKPTFRLDDMRDKTEFEFFQALFPMKVVADICALMTSTGRAAHRQFGRKWEVSEGIFWLWQGLHTHMVCFPSKGPLDQYWAKSVHLEATGTVHNLCKYGMTLQHFRNMQRTFVLPTYGQQATDPFDPIRLFVDSWNANMVMVFVPGDRLCLDESMGRWLGMHMPG